LYFPGTARQGRCGGEAISVSLKEMASGEKQERPRNDGNFKGRLLPRETVPLNQFFALPKVA